MYQSNNIGLNIKNQPEWLTPEVIDAIKCRDIIKFEKHFLNSTTDTQS